MKVTVRVDRPLYGPSGGRRYLWLRLEAPRRPAKANRAPLDIALVLDRSGSMGGRKIELAREAANGVVQVLRETDRCALVSYDNTVETPVACGAVTADQRARLYTELNAISARGGTDLFGGWMAGAEQISGNEAERIRRALLLTDGLANEGLTDPAEIQKHVRELNLRGVGTTTFGIGADFDEYLLTGMAEAGGGHFYFIEKAEQIPDFLASELGELASVVCRNVRVRAEVRGNASLSGLNDIPMVEGQYTLGDLSEGAVVDLLFALEIAAGNEGPLELLVDVSWTDTESNAEEHASEATRLALGSDADAAAAAPDPETVRNVVRTRAARVRHHSLDYNRKGQFREANAAVKAEIAEIREFAAAVPEAAAEVADLDMFAEQVLDTVSLMERKKAQYASYLTRRSR